MPLLQVKELPVNIYQRLQKTAVAILAKGLRTSASNKERREKLLQAIAEQPHPCRQNEKAATVDPVLFVREDRER